MVIDTSALLTILLEEPDGSVYVAAILRDPVRLMSSANLAEASMVAIGRRRPDPIFALDALISRLGIEIVSVNRDQALLAREAFWRYGKGRHAAQLNFGDCFAYALALRMGEPLLFKGNDFSQTDVRRALDR